jgi:trigger factor
MVIDQRFGRGVIIQEAFNDSWQLLWGGAHREQSVPAGAARGRGHQA